MAVAKEMEQKLARDKQDIMYSGLRPNACLLKEGNESRLDELGLWRSENEMWLTGKENKWVNGRTHRSIGLEKNFSSHELNFSDFANWGST